MNDRNQDDSPISAVIAAPPEMHGVGEDASGRVGMGARDPSTRLQSRTTVLLMLFVATGVVGIPLLWVNKKFTNAERIFWSVTVLIYSAAVLALGGAIVLWMWNKTMAAIAP